MRFLKSDADSGPLSESPDLRHRIYFFDDETALDEDDGDDAPLFHTYDAMHDTRQVMRGDIESAHTAGGFLERITQLLFN